MLEIEPICPKGTKIRAKYRLSSSRVRHRGHMYKTIRTILPADGEDGGRTAADVWHQRNGG